MVEMDLSNLTADLIARTGTADLELEQAKTHVRASLEEDFQAQLVRRGPHRRALATQLDALTNHYGMSTADLIAAHAIGAAPPHVPPADACRWVELQATLERIQRSAAPT